MGTVRLFLEVISMKFEINFETEEVVKVTELIAEIIKAEDTRCQRADNYKAVEKVADMTNSQIREVKEFVTKTIK